MVIAPNGGYPRIECPDKPRSGMYDYTEAGTVTPITTPIFTPEISAGELVGMLGFRYLLRERIFFTLGVSYDNNHAVLLRPGLTFYFNRPGRTHTK
jgi:hypothetical protein